MVRVATTVACASGPAPRSEPPFISSRNAAYDTDVATPASTPSTGSLPYAALSNTPEISTTPANTTGVPTISRDDGRSPKTAHAANATMNTCRLPSTVASPAPT